MHIYIYTHMFDRLTAFISARLLLPRSAHYELHTTLSNSFPKP